MGVPSNSFNQEKNSNKEVKEFCEYNFNITFPITEITEVKGEMLILFTNGLLKIMVHQLYLKWNFHKILINKQGRIEDVFSSLTKPTSMKIVSKIEELINS